MNDIDSKKPLMEGRHIKKYFWHGGGLFGSGKVKITAVDDVSIQVFPFETVGLVGESGSGKSTLGKCLLRIYEPSEGNILFDGVDITHLSHKEMLPILPKMQLVFQNPYTSLNPRMRIRNIVSEPLQIQNRYPSGVIEERVKELLSYVGLSWEYADRLPHELSGGQRQRIALARALALEPKFLVLDEPTSALDVSVQAQVINLIVDLQEKFGFSYLFISHNLAVIRHVCDRILLMYLGKVVEAGSKKDVFQNAFHPYTKVLLAANPEIDDFQKNPGDFYPVDTQNLTTDHSGCRFAPRCERKMEEICLREIPELVEVTPGHYVACHLFSESI